MQSKKYLKLEHDGDVKDSRIIITHSCQDMTRPPRMLAGVFSAAKTGDVVALGPIPKPSNRRQTCTFVSLSRTFIEKEVDVQKAGARFAQIPHRER
jgi:hypothetical protein